MPNTDVYGTSENVVPLQNGNLAPAKDLAKKEIPGLIPPKDRAGSSTPITEILVELEFVSQEQIDEAVAAAQASNALSPKQVLLDSYVISPDQLSRAMAERFGLDYLDLTTFNANPAAVNLISVETARRYRAVPVEFLDEKSVLIAVTDPTNVLSIDDLGILTGKSVKPVVVCPTDLEALISQMSKLDESIEEVTTEEEAEEITDIRETADDAPVIKFTHAVIASAIESKASDIHFEPDDDSMRVRYRIDGVLKEITTLPKRMIPGVVSRVKVMADLDITEHRKPQDGRVSLKVEGRPVDIRIVTLPSAHGETVVMRLLDKEQSALSFSRLGLRGSALECFERALSKPYGTILVTGPTGAGKTTTLYAGLQLLNVPEKSILTVEDPVEYQISGITQIQVNPKSGLVFSTGLRSMLRADPDIMMVGEIRDHETARITVEAALTGHLVLTTLHTNNAPSAITRLIDMGIEPFLIASAIDCVVAQRLARSLCADCKKAKRISAEDLRANGFEVSDDEPYLDAFEAEGCRRCGLSGYRGRVGVFEVMGLSDQVRQLTVERQSADAIKAQACRDGMTTLREAGLELVREGLSSVAEVTRVIT